MKSTKFWSVGPEGSGPFPAVVYNHGNIVDAVGFAKAKAAGNKLDQICEQLAKDGFVHLFLFVQNGELAEVTAFTIPSLQPS